VTEEEIDLEASKSLGSLGVEGRRIGPNVRSRSPPFDVSMR